MNEAAWHHRPIAEASRTYRHAPGRTAGSNVEAFVALMAELGVEAVPLPDSEAEAQDDEPLPASDSATA
jgi:hypothetical protein